MNGKTNFDVSSINVGKGYLLTIKVGLVVRETLTDVRENLGAFAPGFFGSIT